MISLSDSVASAEPAPRKWDSEITKARRHGTWLGFEAYIHQSAADGQTGSVRARVARALDRYGLGTSDVVVDEALDYLTHKELGAAARYYNQTGKAPIGKVRIVVDGATIATHDLYPAADVPAGGLFRRAIDTVRLWFN